MTKQEMEKDFLLFLHEEGILNELESTSIKYEETYKRTAANKYFLPPFRFHLKLDLEKMKNTSHKLYRLFVKEPTAGLTMAKNIIFCAIDLVVSSAPLEKSDLQIAPLILNLPITNEITNLLLRPSHQLETIRGILISRTTIAEYKRSSYSKCETVACPKNKWKRYEGIKWSTCPDCYGLMKEHVSSADMGEEIHCQFLSLKTFNAMGRFQALSVSIRDELCSATDFQIGEEYIITGRLNEKFFEAMNIRSFEFEPPIYLDIPQSIAVLHFEVSQKQKNCPWSFPIALSSFLGSHIIPQSSFLNLKLGLMLSLATVESDHPVPILAVGSDVLNVQILFRAAGKLTERYVKLSPAQTVLGGREVKTGSQSKGICQEAGQFIMAARGICDLGDWHKYKKEQSNYICQTLESGQVFFNKSEMGKSNSTSFLPLKCSIWTQWNDSARIRNVKHQLKTLINVFGIPFLGEETNEIELTKISWRNLKATASDFQCRHNGGRVPADEDVKRFYKMINSREMTLSESATQLIRSYFVVSRRDRPHCLPLGAIQTITSLSEAHARLALRDEVVFEDVVAVIYLYEEAMANVYGESLITYTAAVMTCNEEEEIYVQMSERIRNFSDLLIKYVGL